MRTPTPAQLLQAWERGGEASATTCCLALLDAGCDEFTAEALASLPLGRRDTLLLQLRSRLFGDDVCGVATCPACGATVEATFRCSELVREPPTDAETTMAPEYLYARDDVRVRFRLPDSLDLLALQACSDPGSTRQVLLERCVVDVESGRGVRGLQLLSPTLQAGLAQAMASVDPQIDVQLAVTCPDCAQQWQPLFDIARFLWQELHAWALRTLREIDTLARSYRWSEADILALSPRRRQAYLELCAP
jgi:hypothetical protein